MNNKGILEHARLTTILSGVNAPPKEAIALVLKGIFSTSSL